MKALSVTADSISSGKLEGWMIRNTDRKYHEFTEDSMAEGCKDIAAVKQAHKATRATCWNLLVFSQAAFTLYYLLAL